MGSETVYQPATCPSCEGTWLLHDGFDDPDVEADWELLPLYAGQSTGLIRTIKPAAEIVAEMTAGAKAALSLSSRYANAR